MTFVKGQSGNPAGRPLGCKNKVNREFDAELLNKGEYLAGQLFQHFADGNATALRLVTQRMAPVPKTRTFDIDLPQLNSPADRPAAMDAIRRALCEGEITIEEANGLIGYVDKALGYDHAAVAKGQLVALMREVVGLRSEVALMAARLDAELGPDGLDNIKTESSAEDGPVCLRPIDWAADSVDNINAESTSRAAAENIDAPAVSEAGIGNSNAESNPAAQSTTTNDHGRGDNEGESKGMIAEDVSLAKSVAPILPWRGMVGEREGRAGVG